MPSFSKGREDAVDDALAKLTDDERKQILIAANSGGHGGKPLEGDFLDRAVQLGLAFRSTGRLRMDVVKRFLLSAIVR